MEKDRCAWPLIANLRHIRSCDRNRLHQRSRMLQSQSLQSASGQRFGSVSWTVWTVARLRCTKADKRRAPCDTSLSLLAEGKGIGEAAHAVGYVPMGAVLIA
jgi:hypothetical protein